MTIKQYKLLPVEPTGRILTAIEVAIATCSKSLARHATIEAAYKAAIEAAPEQPVQEPVAVYQVKLDGNGNWKDIAKGDLQNYPEKDFWETRTMYTAPQAQPAVESLGAWYESLPGFKDSVFYGLKQANEFAAPQAQQRSMGKSHSSRWNGFSDNTAVRQALDEWIEKTEWVQKTATPAELGLHRADVLTKRLTDTVNVLASAHFGYQAKLRELKTQKNELMDQRDELLAALKGVEARCKSSGYVGQDGQYLKTISSTIAKAEGGAI